MPRYMKTPYSIETRRGATSGGKNGAGTEAVVAAAEVDLSEVMEAIRNLERKIDGGVSVSPASGSGNEAVAAQDRKIEEIRTEIADIAGRIQATKVEIAALRHPLSNDDKFEAASAELSQIVRQTEGATESIMSNAEKIEEVLADLMSVTSDEYANSRLGEIADFITAIYESCNFQDLTGQRITKVIKVLNYIEERVDAMMKTWDIREFQTMPLPKDITRKDEDLTLSGPMQEGEAISQEEIDAMFD